MQFGFGFRKKNGYVLMHKEKPVFSAEYDKEKIEFTKIKEIFDFDHVPYSVREADQTINLKKLNHWFILRGIPGYRVGLNRLLDRLDMDDQLQLLNSYYALSVSDHYWLKEEDKEITYKRISFFNHSFDQDGFGRAMFSLGRADVDDSVYRTPNNTLAGYQKKAWFHRNGILYIYKGGTFPYQLEPVHEKLASEMARRLGMDAVSYTTSVYENQVVSVCANMLDEEHDLITADEVLGQTERQKEKFEYYTYIDILKEHGITNASKALNDMLVLDFLMMNTDRHNQNLGVIINCETMQWEKAAPIFDTGTGLACLRSDDEVVDWPEYYNYRLFNSSKIPDNVIPYLISDLKRYDFSVLDGIDQFYLESMNKHRVISGITEERMRSQSILLNKRIEAIKKLQMKAKK